jgi:hypothetical protein
MLNDRFLPVKIGAYLAGLVFLLYVCTSRPHCYRINAHDGCIVFEATYTGCTLGHASGHGFSTLIFPFADLSTASPGIMGLVGSKSLTRPKTGKENNGELAKAISQLANMLCFWSLWHAILIIENFPWFDYVVSQGGAKYLLVKTLVMILCLNWYLPGRSGGPPMGVSPKLAPGEYR